MTLPNKNHYYVMIALSIIIPVYNVEKYIRECIESIFKQSLDEESFEIIIINDGTKDRSIETIEDIIYRHKNITVINQENQGVSVARNNGIAAANGEYILMPDSDDLLIENSLKPLLEKAMETKVDIVVADYLEMRNEDIVFLKSHPVQRTKDIPFIEKKGKELFMEYISPNQSYIWRFLFRKDFLIQQNISFIPGIYVQDKPFIYESYIKANKCLKVSYPIYIYRKHSESISFSMSEKYAKDYCIAICKICEFTNLPMLSTIQKQRMAEYTFKTISTFTRRLIHEMDEKRKHIEILIYLSQIIQNIDLRQSFKQNILTNMLKKAPRTYYIVLYIYVNLYEDRIRPFIKHFSWKYFCEDRNRREIMHIPSDRNITNNY